MVNEHMRDDHWGINPPSKDELDTAETPRPGVTDYRVAVYRVTAYRVTAYRVTVTIQGRTKKKSYYYEVSAFHLRRRIDAILINHLALTQPTHKPTHEYEPGPCTRSAHFLPTPRSVVYQNEVMRTGQPQSEL